MNDERIILEIRDTKQSCISKFSFENIEKELYFFSAASIKVTERDQENILCHGQITNISSEIQNIKEGINKA